MRFFPIGLFAAVAAIAGCGAKTDLFGEPEPGDAEEWEIPDTVDRPPTAACPDDEIWTSPGKTTVVNGRGTDPEGHPAFEWTLLASPTGSTATIAPRRTEHTVITPDILGDYRLRFTVTDPAGQNDACDSLVHAVEHPPTALCPDDVTGVPIRLPVTLEGDGRDEDGTIVGFEWSVQLAPEGASPTLRPTNAATTQITPDVEGLYQVRFEVIDDNGYRGHCVVEVTAVGGPVLDCPTEDLTGPTRRPVTLTVPVISGTVVAWRWEVTERPTASNPGLFPVPVDGASPTFTPDKPGRYAFRATATDDQGLTASCTLVLIATPSGPDALCPAEITGSPLAELTLNGNAADDGTIVAWRWDLVSAPEGSSTAGPSPADAQIARFIPDVAGTFVIRLTVTDNDGNSASCTFNVIAIPSEGLRVEMFWNPPDRSCDTHPDPCDGSDVDLHLLHPNGTRWFTETDCYYGNCNAGTGASILEWDRPGPPDNPRLDQDDTEGYGPENINIDEPVVGHEYWVGVHYYHDSGWPGAAHVTVKIYCSTISADPVAQYGPVGLRIGDSSDGRQFWRVAAVTWNGSRCTVRNLANADGTPNITTYGYVQSSR